MTTRETFSFAYAVLLSAVALTAVALHFTALDVAQLPKWWIAVVGAAIGSAALVIQALRQGRVALPSRWVLGGAGLFLTTLWIAVAFADETVRGVLGGYSRWNGAAGYTAYVLLCLLAASTGIRLDRIRRLATVILASAGVVAAYAVLQRMGVDPLPWDNVYDASSSFLGNPNYAAAYIGIPAPLVVGRLAEAGRSTRSRLLLLGLLGLMLAGVAVAGALLGPLTMLVGILVTSIVVTTVGDTAWLRTARWISAVGTLSIAGVGAVLMTGSTALPATATIRLYYWRVAWRMFTDHPVTGVGLGRFGDFFRRYRTSTEYLEFGNSALADNPHSVPLSLAAEGGAPVLIGWTVFFSIVIVCVVGWIWRRRRGDPSAPTLVVAAWIGCFAGYLAQALASFDVAPVAVLGFVAAGGVVALTGTPIELRHRPPVIVRRLLALAGIGAAALILVTASVPLRANVVAGEALLVHRNSGDLEAAVESLDEAAAIAWWEPRYRFAAGQLSYQRGDVLGARERFTMNARIFRESPDAVIASARVAAELGRMEEALGWYRQALELDPHNVELAEEAAAAVDRAETST